jgi:hypothetical protein
MTQSSRPSVAAAKIMQPNQPGPDPTPSPTHLHEWVQVSPHNGLAHGIEVVLLEVLCAPRPTAAARQEYAQFDFKAQKSITYMI